MYAHVQMLDTYSDHSFRLMALAVGVIPHEATLAVYQMSLGQIEAHAGELQLLGIIVLSNPIKADSKDTVAELQDRYQHFCLRKRLYETELELPTAAMYQETQPRVSGC